MSEASRSPHTPPQASQDAERIKDATDAQKVSGVKQTVPSATAQVEHIKPSVRNSCCSCDLLFCYVYSIVSLVYSRAEEDAHLPLASRRMLQADELWPLDDDLMSSTATSAVDAAWRAEVAAEQSEPSVLNAIVWRLHGSVGIPRLALLYICKILGSLGQPIFFYCILEFYYAKGLSQGAGYGFVFALVASSILASIFEHQGLYHSGRLKVATSNGLRGLIYKKALRLREFQVPQTAGQAQQNANLGLSQWVSVVAADAPAVAEYLNVICPLWLGILETVACIALMAVIVDYAVLAGLAVVVGLVFVSNSLAVQIGQKAKAIGATGGQRVQMLGQLLGIIRAVKFYAWESEFVSALQKKRAAEEEELDGFQRIKTLSFVVAVIAPVFLGVAVMLIYSAYATITLSIAFPALVLLGILRNVLWNMPLYLSAYLDSGVAAKRIRLFLEAPEVEINSHSQTKQSPEVSTLQLEQIRIESQNVTDFAAVSSDRSLPLGTIRVHDSTFVWSAEDGSFSLSDIAFECQPGTITAVVGSVGSGKSSLVLAVLGEMPLAATSFGAYCKLNGRVAYVPQSAFILNATCKENILFGAPFDPARYDAVVKASELMADFKELIHGENTMIGDKGMTISGGQKQRISIARALYSQTDIVIFDDPLSAVDAHVSNKLFFEAVNGSLLKQRTRLFVTNQTQYLQHCDRVIYLKQGKIAAQGSPSEVISVMQADEAISALATSKADDDDDHESDMTDAKAVSNKAEAASTAASEAASAASPAVAPKAVLAPATPNKTNSPGSYDICDLFNYILRGWWFLALVLVLNLVIFLSLMGHQFSLALYSLHTFSSYNYGQFAAAFVGTFAIIGILAFVRSATVASLTGQCFNELHEQLLRRVFYSPMSFFETHSSGMILEWFGGNLGFLDKAASSLMDLAFATMFLFGLFMIMLVILYPWLLLAAVPVISVVIWLIRVYRPTNFQSTQLKLRTETPVVSHFSQTLAGLISIRAYAAQNVFVRDWFTKLDANGRADIGYVACGQWVTNFADLIGTLLIVGAGVLAVVARDTEVTGILGTSGGSGVAANGQLTLTAARAALSLFFGTWVCTVASRLINIQVSVGDIFSVTTKLRNLLSLPVERESSKQPPANWPSAGAVEIRGLVMRYRPELPPVLRSVSCSIKAGEKIGIVGRTGAGKSSFVTALFRLAEAEAGSQVEIDGVRIDDMNLQALRARLAIITQDPVCVQGSIRYNVDPMHKCQSDDDIWRALDIAQLSPFVRGLPAGLDHQIDSTGSNISLGQRQQLSMARALLHRPKLLIMDEASSSIDNHTDELIQTAMETACKDCTCLIIAHRLNTVMNCDRIMVLERGEIKEFDAPHNILQNPDSLLSGLVRATGKKKAAQLREIAEQKFRLNQSTSH